MRLEKFTGEQKKLLIEVRDSWINQLNSLPKLDENKAREGIKYLYKIANLKEPNITIVRSPYSAVNSAVDSAVRSAVGSAVRSAVDSTVRSAVYSAVGSAVGSAVDSTVRSAVYSAVGSAVGSEFGPSVGIYWFSWASYIDIYEKLGAHNVQWEELRSFLRSGIYEVCLFEKQAYIIPMPEVLTRDSENRLHSTVGPAIRWSDGFELYMLWGVRFTKELFEKITSRAISPKEVFVLTNIEQRMAALKFLGAEAVLDACNSEKIDTSKKGNELYEIKDLGSNKEYCLKYSCPSTGRKYVSFVDPEIAKTKDADTCMAWKFGITKEQYLEMEMES